MTSANPFNNSNIPTPPIDDLIGSAYPHVRTVAQNITAVKHVSANLEDISAISDNLEDLLALSGNYDNIIAASAAAIEAAEEAEAYALQAAGMPVVTVTGNTTLTSDHNGRLIRVNSASPVNITIAPDLPESFTCALLQLGDGPFTMIEGAGVTILQKYEWYDSEGPGALVGVSWHANNMYVIGGDLSL